MLRGSTVGIWAVLGSILSLSVEATDTLEPWAFTPLPLGAVTPGGWLLGELQTEASGLAGHLDDFYIYVNESSWLQPEGDGGEEYSNLNEGLPYWFNGAVPLAYLLDDETLKDQVHTAAAIVLIWQSEDGWIGPEVEADRNFWARIPFFLGLTQLVDANSSWEGIVVDALQKFMTLTNTMLNDDGYGFTTCNADIACYWGQTRIADMMITIQWLLENYPSDQDDLLWENMELFYSLDEYKWDLWYEAGLEEVISNPTTSNPDFPYIHGVNVAQGLKAMGVYRRFNHDDSMVELSMSAVKSVLDYHGAPSGTILGDEILHDAAPYMGSELCTTVETAYTLEYLYQALGDNYYADRAERDIFNALPAELIGDMWAHQYMQQPNQPWAVNNTQDFDTDATEHVFTTANLGEASVFGMEPQYPCCTVNHPQGWPKFTSNSWVAYGTDGLAHALLSPSTVTTTVGGSSVTIECTTDYPFDNVLTYSVDAADAFALYLRVPHWAENAETTVTMDGVTSTVAPNSTTGMHQINVSSGQTTITYTLGPFAPRIEPRQNDTAVSVYVGNLLYALEITTSTTTSEPHAWFEPTGPGLTYLTSLDYPDLLDYYITNDSPYAVAIDTSTMVYYGMSDDDTLPTPVFEQSAPPNYIEVQGCVIEWDLYLDAALGPVPVDPSCIADSETFKLIPYGAAKLHISELPTVSL